MRLFVALELPGPAALALAEFRNAAADPEVWRPVADASLHVTLVFLGHLDDDAVATVEDAVGPVIAAPAPGLRLDGPLLLPPRGARVLCASLEDLDGRLGEVQRDVSDALESAGVYEPEKRPFRAHVTVARLREGSRPPRRAEGLPSPEPVTFEGEAVTLFRSQLRRGGALYEPLVRWGFR